MNINSTFKYKCPTCNSEIAEIILRKDQLINMQMKYDTPLDVPVAKLELAFCYNCTMLFVVNNLVNIKENLCGNLYETSLTSISEDEITTTSETIEILKNYVKEGNILEIGSGQGDFLNQLELNEFVVSGCEPGNSYFISRSKYPNIEVKNNIFEPADYRNKVYDVVIFQNCLEHMPNPREVVENVWNILEENGILFIQIPNFDYSLSHNIYSDIYFEHLLYFNWNCLELFLRSINFKILCHENLNGGRDQLIIAKKSFDASHKDEVSNDFKNNFVNKTNQFVDTFNEYCNEVDKFIDKLNQTGRKIVVYGAGVTLLSNFILTKNGLSFLKKIDFLVDGDENKHGYYLPIIPVPVNSPKILTQIVNPSDFCILICAEKYRYEIYDNIVNELGDKIEDVLIFSTFPNFEKMSE